VDREARFVEEYLSDPSRNGTRAAIRAGYSAKSAHVQASRLLRRDKVRAAIAAADAKAGATVALAIDRYAVSRERIVRELARMAFSDIRQIARFGPQHRIVTMHDGTQVKTAGVSIIASHELDDDAAVAIAEVSEGQHGIRVKLVDKRAALIDLAKLTGIYVEGKRLEHTIDGSVIEAMRALAQRSALPIGRTIEHAPAAPEFDTRAVPAAPRSDDEDPAP
jgi:phage terminase small subunit